MRLAVFQERPASWFGMRYECVVPLAIDSIPNTGVSPRRRQKQQEAVFKYAAEGLRRVRHPTHVTFGRVGPGRLDSDNLIASLKHVRDVVARIYGRDDADWKRGALQWCVPKQEQADYYGLRILVTGRFCRWF